MPVGATVAMVGTSLASGAMQSSAARRAGNQVQQATDRAAELEHQRWREMLGLQMPSYRRAEGAAGIYMQALGLPDFNAGQQPNGPGPSSFGDTGGSGFTAPGLMTGGRGVSFDHAAFAPDAGGGALTQPLSTGQQMTGGLPSENRGGGAVHVGAAGAVNIPAMVMQTPGYQAQLQQGMTAIDRASPLRGGMYSGRRMKALNEHGQDTFGSFYNSWLNRVGGMAGQAPQIAGNIGQAGQQNASQIASLMTQGGRAQANATTNSASAWGNALSDAAGGVGWMGARQKWW